MSSRSASVDVTADTLYGAAALGLKLLREHGWVQAAGPATFASTCFTVSMLLASSWADVIHVRELAVGAAAINTLGNIGAFVMPYGWGVARDATGNFQLGLMALTAATVLSGALILLLRSRVLKTQPFVVAPA